MLIKRTADCNEFTANDGCRIREVLHPRNDNNDGRQMPLSLAVARVEPGRQSYAHYLEQTEVYYILAGCGQMHIDDGSAEVGPGDAVYIPAKARQWIENTGEETLEFVAVCAPAWSAEGDVRL